MPSFEWSSSSIAWVVVTPWLSGTSLGRWVQGAKFGVLVKSVNIGVASRSNWSIGARPRICSMVRVMLTCV